MVVPYTISKARLNLNEIRKLMSNKPQDAFLAYYFYYGKFLTQSREWYSCSYYPDLNKHFATPVVLVLFHDQLLLSQENYPKILLITHTEKSKVKSLFLLSMVKRSLAMFISLAVNCLPTTDTKISEKAKVFLFPV